MVFNHVIRRPCWSTKQKQTVAHVLHNNAIKFSKDVFVLCSNMAAMTSSEYHLYFTKFLILESGLIFRQLMFVFYSKRVKKIFLCYKQSKVVFRNDILSVVAFFFSCDPWFDHNVNRSSLSFHSLFCFVCCNENECWLQFSPIFFSCSRASCWRCLVKREEVGNRRPKSSMNCLRIFCPSFLLHLIWRWWWRNILWSTKNPWTPCSDRNSSGLTGWQL